MRAELADCYAATGLWPGAIRTIESALDGLAEVASLGPLLPEEEKQRLAALAKLEGWKRK